MDYSYTIWIPLLPLITFVLIGLLGGKVKPIVSGITGVLSLTVSACLSIFTAYRYFLVDGAVDGVFQKIIASNHTWLRFTDTLYIDMGVLLDPISVMMLVVITFISLMVHVYSLGYMKGETGFSRFYSVLSLFSFSMLGLVLASNIFQMYMFWELVGVSSYLLIGYYYTKPSAVAASKKAFIVTRFADLGFLVGILILSFQTGTFDFSIITSAEGLATLGNVTSSFIGLSAITWATLLIFIGGAGKSAMFPLHVWLPDAMEGPTPVSALIHAATMVVAGVYLVARLFPVFSLVVPGSLTVVAWVGGFSSLFAAIIACTQIDIKRVLAYSTMSQIGYMMLALGVSGYLIEDSLGFTASMFHLFTHAFFKALLFLGAGAIIHAVHSNVMTEMGGLRKSLPITHITFLVACLAIAGIPPFSGFFSKDEILVAAFEANKILFAIEWLVAGLTAFYMFRLYFSVFWGKNRNYEHEPHEAPLSMTLPLIILAAGAFGAGFIPFSHFVTSTGETFTSHIHWNIAIPSIAVALIGIFVAAWLYKSENDRASSLAASLGILYKSAYNKFYIDEIYLFMTRQVIFKYISEPIAWFDRHIVDGTVNLVGSFVNFVSERIKGFQSGQVQQYAFYFMAGVITLTIVFVYFYSN
ncbi:MAG: NADH-quinone oxidoreductase subunit L [Chitinophagales bacterium]|nr:NADH-quinone oxidoreductase subunit L [Chitinophagales bacterium]